MIFIGVSCIPLPFSLLFPSHILEFLLTQPMRVHFRRCAHKIIIDKDARAFVVLPPYYSFHLSYIATMTFRNKRKIPKYQPEKLRKKEESNFLPFNRHVQRQFEL